MSSRLHSGGRRSSTKTAHATYPETEDIHRLSRHAPTTATQDRTIERSRPVLSQVKRHHSSRRSTNTRNELRTSQTSQTKVNTSHRPAVRKSHSSEERRRPSSRHTSSTVKGSSIHSNRVQQATKPQERRTKEASTTGSRTAVQKEQRKLPGIFSLFFSPPEPQVVKRVTCITCLSDDVPITKSAKLACSHRMCYACLRRIFTLSVTDPQHMPPKCCTQDPIPAKYVEMLFDQKFKAKWNQKYKEFATKNRYYCPSKTCSEWIKPSHIVKDRDGNCIYGKCPRCKTRVCCLCHGKWHGSKTECPKDETFQKLEEMAKENGWQKCYNCSSLVELKEGCNHMTCRCSAQFCMLCGAKWKTCDCPWFNYNNNEGGAGGGNWVDDSDNDSDDDEGNAAARAGVGGARYRPRYIVHQFLVGRPPLRYQDELWMRREQEWTDQDLARHLQWLEMQDDDV